MKDAFVVKSDGRVFLGNKEIPHVMGFSVDVDAGEDPVVAIRVSVDDVTIEGYKDFKSRFRQREWQI